MSPVQGCGRVDGYPWYFRARGDSWWVEIADDLAMDEEVLPVVGASASGWLVRGDWPEAGHMAEERAWELVEAVIEQFRKRALPYTAGSGA
jgi:hypothetical protein